MFASINGSHPISDLVRQINKLFPDPGLKHLKKIRRTESGECHILLGRKQLVQQNMHLLQSLSLTDMQDCDVPSSQPLTRSQFEECKLQWPTSFHENKYIKKCMDGMRFSPQELERIHRIIGHLESKRKESGKHVTLIVSGEKVLASESDESDCHPLHHATMLAIDAMARSQLQDRESSEAYLCTNCDAFTSEEVCLMCAMALLHSRIARIFFLNDSPARSCPPDAPFSRMKLHVNDQLNHRFEVWCVRAAGDGDECTSLSH